MKWLPQRNRIVGTQVEITMTAGGIFLPDAQGLKATIFALIELVGPDVALYKPGDIVMPRKSDQIYLRGGYHRLVFEDVDVIVLGQDLPLDRISVGGKPLKPTADGKFVLPEVGDGVNLPV